MITTKVIKALIRLFIFWCINVLLLKKYSDLVDWNIENKIAYKILFCGPLKLFHGPPWVRRLGIAVLNDVVLVQLLRSKLFESACNGILLRTSFVKKGSFFITVIVVRDVIKRVKNWQIAFYEVYETARP